MELKRRLDKYIGKVLTVFIISLFFWKKFPKRLDKTKIRSVLVMKLSGLGDYALLVSTLVALKKTLNPKELILLTLSNSNIELINPEVFDKILHFRKENIFIEFFHILLTIRRQKFDLIIDFTFSPYITAILTFLSNAKFSIGYKTMGLRRILYNYTLSVFPTGHTAEAYYEAVRYLLDEPNKKLEITSLKVPYDEEFVKHFLKTNSISDKDLLIGIHPFSFSSGTYKKYGIAERYSFLAERLVNEYSAKIVFSGTEEEGVYAKGILNIINSTAVIFCLNLSLTELFSIMAHYDLFISVDSGPMHVVSLLGIPTIGIFGPDTPVRYGPIGANCRYIYHKVECSPCIVSYEAKWNQCTDWKCMKIISIDEIMHEVKVMLGSDCKLCRKAQVSP